MGAEKSINFVVENVLTDAQFYYMTAFGAACQAAVTVNYLAYQRVPLVNRTNKEKCKIIVQRTVGASGVRDRSLIPV
jgi:hypothetical protein